MVDELKNVPALLRQDLARTLGKDYADLVRHALATVVELDTLEPDEKIVGDVQQALHDTLQATNWPVCPRHERHPLWYREGGWWCDQDGVCVAALGALPSAPDRD